MTDEPVEDQLKRMFGMDDMKKALGMEENEFARRIREINEIIQQKK